ncbi:type 4a pilus biogenesis protein PilO [Allochromatium vinosum]|uniref:Pilus assembly protein PilO n=1 Tax=Allochromatium vinosum (strain ATCC 17899 / DSM 180 / NBRC 103801 / NCIMB 10441 / D) TaxID=572477 RepID=D3RS19_ALLVD|nr:type 4a pilus biogenesis protein PilO [Allochromatium vinosum]ADC63956.1 Pilus assembly protein PilO [Allochromatium vinosum DSM 180]MBK1654396.1 pilus assembly protein PilO [Allochromatium vinosum]
MDLNELNQLDINDFGEWPIPIKAVAILIACIALGGLAYYYDTSGQLDRLAQEQKTEQDLRTSLAIKQQKAANLQAYRDQLAEMEQSFGAMLKQLPNRTEVAALLVDVSQTGLANGLEFELFQPENEITREFYAELPIRIRVRGNYHDFGRFVSGLAALPRIVTIHDVQISDSAGQSTGGQPAGTGDGPLVLQATVKTYRYLEEGVQ